MPSWSRRAASTATDFFLALLLSALTADTLGTMCAERAVDALAIGDPESWWHGPVPLVLGVLGNVVYSLPITVLAVGLARLAFGHTPGQALWRLPTGSRDWLEWADDYAPALLLTLALLLASLLSTEVLLGLGAVWLIYRGIRSQARRGAATNG